MTTGNLAIEPLGLLARIIALLVAIAVHEFSHAFVADRLGDPTPRDAGRLTLNPFKHLSPWGTLFLFLFRFGWSQPVPVNAQNFRRPAQGMLLTSLAGPVSNFLVAAVSAIAIRYVPANTYMPMLLQEMIFLNLVLMVFNLLPIPPLDGSSLLPFILPRNSSLLLNIERQGFLILVGLMMADVALGGRILSTVVGIPVATIAALLLGQ